MPKSIGEYCQFKADETQDTFSGNDSSRDDCYKLNYGLLCKEKKIQYGVSLSHFYTVNCQLVATIASLPPTPRSFLAWWSYHNSVKVIVNCDLDGSAITQEISL